MRPHTATNLLVAVIDLYGGTGTFCRSLLAGLRRFYPGEFNVTLLLMRSRGMLPGDGDLADDVVILGKDVHTGWRRLHETILHALRLRRYLAGARADVVFTIGTFMNVLVPLAAPRLRVIASQHTNLSHQLARQRFTWLIRAASRLAYGRVPVVAPAEGVADDLRRNFGARRAIAILHGVDAEAIEALARETPADLPQKPYLIAVARLTGQKDYPTLLRAYALAAKGRLRIADCGLPVRGDVARGDGGTVGIPDLMILGQGEDRDALVALVRELGIADHAHFVGHRDNPYPYMRHARGLILSSSWEGFGLVLLEAMSLGTPVISTDCPSGPAEILSGGTHGLLVRPGDPVGLAEAIGTLCAEPGLREHLAEQGRVRARELTLARMVEQYRAIFRS